MFLMEYYIMKLYEDKKKENKLKVGLNRFYKDKKIAVIILLSLMILSIISMMVLLFLFPKDFWFLFGLIICAITVIILLVLDTKDQKVNLDSHIGEYKKQIDILYKVLKNDFKINSKEKIVELIQIYKTYIDKRDKEEKTRNKVIMALFSGLSAALSASLVNLDTIGIDFYSWLYFAAFLLISLGVVNIFIYSYKYFDSLKHRYENMVNDLESLNLYKY